MLVVVPLEETTAELQCIFVASKSFGKLRTVLHGFELAFRERIVVGNMRPAVRLRDTQRAEQLGDRMRCHRRPTIAVNDQLFGLHVLFLDRRFNELLGQAGAFAVRQHPADNAAAVDVEDHVQVVVSPFFRTLELGDVPRPDFVRGGRKQFRLLVVGMLQLVSSFACALILFEDAVHRPHAAQVVAFIKQLCVNLTW